MGKSTAKEAPADVDPGAEAPAGDVDPGEVESPAYATQADVDALRADVDALAEVVASPVLAGALADVDDDDTDTSDHRYGMLLACGDVTTALHPNATQHHCRAHGTVPVRDHWDLEPAALAA